MNNIYFTIYLWILNSCLYMAFQYFIVYGKWYWKDFWNWKRDLCLCTENIYIYIPFSWIKELNHYNSLNLWVTDVMSIYSTKPLIHVVPGHINFHTVISCISLDKQKEAMPNNLFFNVFISHINWSQPRLTKSVYKYFYYANIIHSASF